MSGQARATKVVSTATKTADATTGKKSWADARPLSRIALLPVLMLRLRRSRRRGRRRAWRRSCTPPPGHLRTPTAHRRYARRHEPDRARAHPGRSRLFGPRPPADAPGHAASLLEMG